MSVVTPPVVYLLHGEDEFAITRFIADLKARLGEPAMVQLNVTRLEGHNLSLDELRLATQAAPVFTRRRMVVVRDAQARFAPPALREKFFELVAGLPASTALLLVEVRMLGVRDKQKKDWLLYWAMEAGDRVYVRSFPTLQGSAMVSWILDQAQAFGGKFSPAAAARLAYLIGEDSRQIHQEIQKLLLYVNYQRQVETDDVEALTSPASSGDIFALVDALGNQDGPKAMGVLHRLLVDSEPSLIFGMVVRQFRLLLQARQILAQGGGENEMSQEVHLHKYEAEKLIVQARRLPTSLVEMAFQRLLEIDEAVKTSRMEWETAMDVFLTTMTARLG